MDSRYPASGASAITLYAIAVARPGLRYPWLWSPRNTTTSPAANFQTRPDLGAPLALWSVQTAFAARPWAAEMPSAGRPLSWSTLLELRRRGVEIAALTHAAGLSQVGDPALDALLPLPERYDLPASTVAAIAHTHARGGRVIAAGTTVVRALEGCFAEQGALRPGHGETSLLLHAGFVPRVVDGLLTGMHDPSESHFHLLRAFASEPVLLAAWRHASAAGYLQHEFGDATLLAPDLPLSA